MKKNLDLLTRLHYELNLDNFFNAEVFEFRVTILGWHTPELEKLLFEKGYQVTFESDRNQYIYENLMLKIILSIKKEEL